MTTGAVKMTKFSDTVITEDNEDELHDLLCEVMNVSCSTSCNVVYGDLPSGFSGPFKLDENPDVDYHVKSVTKPNHAAGEGAYVVGTLAFVFNNGFILMPFGEAI